MAPGPALAPRVAMVQMRYESLKWSQLTSPTPHSAWADGDPRGPLDRSWLSSVRNRSEEMCFLSPGFFFFFFVASLAFRGVVGSVVERHGHEVRREF